MDWTIVVSVLVALLLWPVVLASVAAVLFLPVAVVLRGRFRRLMETKMEQCKEMFGSRTSTAAEAGSTGPEACACATSSEGGS
jgi:hypothetical protein